MAHMSNQNPHRQDPVDPDEIHPHYATPGTGTPPVAFTMKMSEATGLFAKAIQSQ